MRAETAHILAHPEAAKPPDPVPLTWGQQVKGNTPGGGKNKIVCEWRVGEREKGEERRKGRKKGKKERGGGKKEGRKKGKGREGREVGGGTTEKIRGGKKGKGGEEGRGREGGKEGGNSTSGKRPVYMRRGAVLTPGGRSRGQKCMASSLDGGNLRKGQVIRPTNGQVRGFNGLRCTKIGQSSRGPNRLLWDDRMKLAQRPGRACSGFRGVKERCGETLRREPVNTNRSIGWEQGIRVDGFSNQR